MYTQLNLKWYLFEIIWPNYKAINTFLIFQILLIINSYSQNDSVESKLFNNDSIKYDIRLVTPSVYKQKDINVAKYFVQINIPKAFKMHLETQDTTFWFKNLAGENTDWATNLILYCLYRKDATSLMYVYNTRKKWLKTKSVDLEYWKKYLKKNSKIK